MFKLIIKYVGFLKHIPLFPAILDAWMTIWTTTFSPQITKAIDATESEVSSWPGISIAPHRFGGIQFNCFSREIGHIHGNGILDILFDRKTKYDLIKKGTAMQHHSFAHSGWISFVIRSEKDISTAVELLRLSYARQRQNL